MTAERIDGKVVASEVKADLARRVERLVQQGVRPGLGTILVGDHPGSQMYVAGKHRDSAQVGIESIRVNLPAAASASQVAEAIAGLNEDPRCTGFIVQLPLPAHLDDNWALELIDPAKDADGLHPVNLGRLVLGVPAPLPCTPLGILELLRYHEVELSGAEVVMVGRGTTVGRPMGLLLTRKTENATVTLCHTGTRDLAAHTRRADVVVVAAGRPGMITADMVAEGSVLIDVGINPTDDGLVGDLADDVWQKARLVTPVPGGVGLMTRAMLLANVVGIAELQV